MNNLIEVVLTAVMGSAGVLGLFFYFFRRYIENRLIKNEVKRTERIAERRELLQLEDNLQHCYGRMFFWLHKAIVTGTHNGDLEKAFCDLQQAEKAKKNFDRKIIAVHQQHDE